MSLLVAPCSREAALYAVVHWHYSRKLPAGRLVYRGVWEDGRFVGAVIFGRGSTPYLGRTLQLSTTEIAELVRVALDVHEHPVSEIVAAALRDLHSTNPGLRAVISFADPEQGHHGGIYQAGNWIYTGRSQHANEFEILGRRMHPRSVHLKGWRQSLPWLHEHVDPDARFVKFEPKHRYVMPLDRSMRRRVERLRLPAPERGPLAVQVDGR